MSIFTKAVVAGLFLSLSATAGGSQSQPRSNEAFASENAILDTSVLFAIGAREARQELRGSFGWPTFQEGLVEGVYFRFDPDGYARFSPTPRLDTDVFEVICRPRTHSCMGRKGNLSFMLNSRAQLQLKLENVAEGDRFFVFEGVSELEVPARILQPLDDRMETLLASSEELVVRRGPNEIERVSLVGFAAVSAYLRWIGAQQDYTVLPRGWPVPNTVVGNTQANLTQVANWQSPMPQPQAVPQLGNGAMVETEVAEVRGELNMLRDILLERNAAEATPPAAMPQSTPEAALPVLANNHDDRRLAELERNTTVILEELDRLRQENAQLRQVSAFDQTDIVPAELDVAPQTASPEPVETAQPTTKDPSSLAERLDYLMTEIGLDARTAVMIVEIGSDGSATPSNQMATTANVIEDTYQDKVVSEILAELQSSQDAEPRQLVEPSPVASLAITSDDYVLLSDYFRSVFGKVEIER